MNYKKQGYRDRLAGEKIDDCPYAVGLPAYAAYRAGWRDADFDLEGDIESDGPTKPGDRKTLGVLLSTSQKKEIDDRADAMGMTSAAFVRWRALS